MVVSVTVVVLFVIVVVLMVVVLMVSVLTVVLLLVVTDVVGTHVPQSAGQNSRIDGASHAAGEPGHASTGSGTPLQSRSVTVETEVVEVDDIQKLHVTGHANRTAKSRKHDSAVTSAHNS